jgi:hypothetical protein
VTRKAIGLTEEKVTDESLPNFLIDRAMLSLVVPAHALLLPPSKFKLLYSSLHSPVVYQSRKNLWRAANKKQTGSRLEDE